MKKQHKRIVTSENEIVLAYAKPRKHNNKLLDTQFLSYSKSLSNKKQNGFSPNIEPVELEIPQQDAPIEQIRASFIEICEREDIEHFYSNHLLSYSSLLSVQQQKTLLIQEISDIDSGESYYQDIMRLISARSNCIKKLKIALSGGSDNCELIERQSELEKYCCILSHLRLLTVMIIEKVEAWRRSLVELELRGKKNEAVTNSPLVFLHEGKSVLHKLFRDSFFLHMTSLRKYIQFSKGFDPLMLGPMRRIINNSSTAMRNYDSVVRLFEVGLDMRNRLQAAEIALMEEQVMHEEQRNFDHLGQTKKHYDATVKKSTYHQPFKSSSLIKQQKSRDLEEQEEKYLYRKDKRKDRVFVDLGEYQKVSTQLLPRITKKRNQTEVQSKRYKTEEDHFAIENTSQYNSPEKTASVFKIKKQRIVNEILQSSKLPSITHGSQLLRRSNKNKSHNKSFFMNNTYEQIEESEESSEEQNIYVQKRIQNQYLQNNSIALKDYRSKNESPDRRAGMIKRRRIQPVKNDQKSNVYQDEELQRRMQAEKVHTNKLARSNYADREEPRILRRNPILNYSLTKIQYKIAGSPNKAEESNRVNKKEAVKNIMTKVQERSKQSTLSNKELVKESKDLHVQNDKLKASAIGSKSKSESIEKEKIIDVKSEKGEEKHSPTIKQPKPQANKTAEIQKQTLKDKNVQDLNITQSQKKQKSSHKDINETKKQQPEIEQQQKTILCSVKKQSSINQKTNQQIIKQQKQQEAEQECERQKLKQIESEEQKQKQLNIQRQLELQKQKEIQKQRELQKQKQLIRQKERKERELQIQQQKEKERQRQILQQQQKQRQEQILKQKLLKEKQKQQLRKKQIEREIQREKEMQTIREEEKQKEKEREKEKIRQQEERRKQIQKEEQKQVQEQKQREKKQKKRQRQIEIDIEREKKIEEERSATLLNEKLKQQQEETKRQLENEMKSKKEQIIQQNDSKTVSPENQNGKNISETKPKNIFEQPSIEKKNEQQKQKANQESKQREDSKPKEEQFKLFITSKNLHHNQLSEYLNSNSHLFSKEEFPTIKELLMGENKQFLHVYMHEVKINTTIAGLIVSSPLLKQSRAIRIYLCRLLYTVVELKKTYKILHNFLDFIWTNDPCDEIHVMQLKDYPDYQMVEILTDIKAKTRTQKPFFAEISPEYFVLNRKKKCKNEDQEDCLFRFENIQICSNYAENKVIKSVESEKLSPQNYYSPEITEELLRHHCKTFSPTISQAPFQKSSAFPPKLKCNVSNFPNLASLNQDLDEEDLPAFQANQPLKNVSLLKSILYDSFELPFLVNKNLMIFPVNTEFVTMYESQTDIVVMIRIRRSYGNLYFTLLKSKSPAKESVKQSIASIISTTVKPDLKSQEDDLIGIRFFKKQLSGRVLDYEKELSVDGKLLISFNWVDYLKGVKLIEEEDIFVTFESNYYLALLDEGHNILFGTYITPKDML